ncbi:anti-sigma factor [Cryobacterium sp. PH31-O1]|uniref:anti-sigma factor n=1 Tax=Cryobacterium sp. PH31-O1 TaxID=3046306 RepID=UPI0024B95042|nr:anti-sigma factor [Cryobacterium sp. PH31-O1]MDJ0338119.1 anti-sigma factor [Cryobacterium sp. PH31-O1]
MIPTDLPRSERVHIGADDLHLFALAELGASAGQRAHLATCAECASEYLALHQVVQLGRAAASDRLLAPPATVWAGIHAELGLSEAVRTPAQLSAPPSPVPLLLSAPAPLPLPSRRRWVPFAAAAGVVGLVGLVGGIAIGIASTTADSPLERVVAQAALDALPGWSASGSARVEQSAEGRRTVVVDLDATAVPSTSLREVWLLKADASGLVSVGFLDGSTGRFVIPASVDLAQYPLVDVSAEPSDGNPAHSGDSIVRGALRGL